MALGLSALTDDQLFELLNEACDEMAQRDSYIREKQQEAVMERGEKLKLQRKALDEFIEEVRKEYIEGIRKDIRRDVEAKVKSGEIQLLTADEESVEILKADRAAREGIKKLLKQECQGAAEFSVEFRGRNVTVRIGSFSLTSEAMISTRDAQKLIEQMIDF